MALSAADRDLLNLFPGRRAIVLARETRRISVLDQPIGWPGREARYADAVNTTPVSMTTHFTITQDGDDAFLPTASQKLSLEFSPRGDWLSIPTYNQPSNPLVSASGSLGRQFLLRNVLDGRWIHAAAQGTMDSRGAPSGISEVSFLGPDASLGWLFTSDLQNFFGVAALTQPAHSQVGLASGSPFASELVSHSLEDLEYSPASGRFNPRGSLDGRALAYFSRSPTEGFPRAGYTLTTTKRCLIPLPFAGTVDATPASAANDTAYPFNLVYRTRDRDGWRSEIIDGSTPGALLGNESCAREAWVLDRNFLQISDDGKTITYAKHWSQFVRSSNGYRTRQYATQILQARQQANGTWVVSPVTESPVGGGTLARGDLIQWFKQSDAYDASSDLRDPPTLSQFAWISSSGNRVAILSSCAPGVLQSNSCSRVPTYLKLLKRSGDTWTSTIVATSGEIPSTTWTGAPFGNGGYAGYHRGFALGANQSLRIGQISAADCTTCQVESMNGSPYLPWWQAAWVDEDSFRLVSGSPIALAANDPLAPTHTGLRLVTVDAALANSRATLTIGDPFPVPKNGYASPILHVLRVAPGGKHAVVRTACEIDVGGSGLERGCRLRGFNFPYSEFSDLDGHGRAQSELWIARLPPAP